MKKKIAILFTAATITATSAFATGVMADPGMGGQPPQMGSEQQAPQGGGEQGQMPEMNGQAPQGGEQGQMPGMNGRGPQMGGKGRRGEGGPGQVSFEDLLKDGTVSQETYDSIIKYMKENAPEKPEDNQNAQNAEDSQNTQNTEDTQSAGQPELKEGKDMPDLLSDLLKNNVITQEEYDKIKAAEEKNAPAKPAGDQNQNAASENASGNTTNNTTDNTTESTTAYSASKSTSAASAETSAS